MYVCVVNVSPGLLLGLADQMVEVSSSCSLNEVPIEIHTVTIRIEQHLQCCSAVLELAHALCILCMGVEILGHFHHSCPFPHIPCTQNFCTTLLLYTVKYSITGRG